MTDKYQDALDKMNSYNMYPIDELREAYTELQELIDNYEKLDKVLDKACDYLVKLSNKVPYLYLPVETTKDWKEWLLKDE